MYGYHPNAITHRKPTRKLTRAIIDKSKRRHSRKRKTKLDLNLIQPADFIKHEPKYNTICLKKGILIKQRKGKNLLKRSILSQSTADDIDTFIESKRFTNSVHFPDQDEDLVTVHTVENWKHYNIIPKKLKQLQEEETDDWLCEQTDRCKCRIF